MPAAEIVLGAVLALSGGLAADTLREWRFKRRDDVRIRNQGHAAALLVAAELRGMKKAVHGLLDGYSPAAWDHDAWRWHSEKLAAVATAEALLIITDGYHAFYRAMAVDRRYRDDYERVRAGKGLTSDEHAECERCLELIEAAIDSADRFGPSSHQRLAASGDTAGIEPPRGTGQDAQRVE